MKRIIFLILVLVCSAFGLPNGISLDNTGWVGLPRSSAPAFNPQTQGTLVNWYDGSVLGLSNGAAVNSFTDSKTGAPNTLTGTGTYATNVQNGKSVVSFNGSSNFYGATGGSTASTFPYTFAAVVNVANLSSAHTIVGCQANGGIQFRIDTAGTLTLNKSNTAAIGTSTGTISAGAYHLLVATVDSSSYAFYIDGVAAGSGSHAQTLTAARTITLGTITSATELFSGGVGEIQIYNSILSSGDLSGLHTYIVNKWATP